MSARETIHHQTCSRTSASIEMDFNYLLNRGTLERVRRHFRHYEATDAHKRVLDCTYVFIPCSAISVYWFLVSTCLEKHIVSADVHSKF